MKLPRALIPVVGVGLLVWLGRVEAAVVVGVVALVVFIIGVVRPSVADWIDLKLGLLARLASNLVSVVLAAVLFVIGVVPAWLIGKAFAIDMDSRRVVGWDRVLPVRGYEESTLSVVSRAPAPRPVGRARYRLVLRRLLGVAVVLGALLALFRAGGEGVGPAESGTPWARSNDFPVEPWSFPNEPWAHDLLREYSTYEKDPLLGWRLVDKSTEHVTVIDGNRVTTGVSDPGLRIWMFGGSTTYGVGQRDQGTIASVMVRLALNRGIRLEITNFGVPGYNNWQESLEFADLLKRGDRPRPDLAIFYDGANEVAQAWERVDYGLFDLDVPHLLGVSEEERDARARNADRRGYKRLSDDQIEDVLPKLVAGQYQLGVNRILGVSSSSGVPVILYWQPKLLDIPVDRPRVRDLLKLLDSSPEALEWQASLVARPPELDGGVAPVDLTRIYDHVNQPVFFDWAHTNEYGARLSAEAILDHLWPQLVRLAKG